MQVRIRSRAAAGRDKDTTTAFAWKVQRSHTGRVGVSCGPALWLPWRSFAHRFHHLHTRLLFSLHSSRRPWNEILLLNVPYRPIYGHEKESQCILLTRHSFSSVENRCKKKKKKTFSDLKAFPQCNRNCHPFQTSSILLSSETAARAKVPFQKFP